MNIIQATIGLRVVRSKGDYVVGRTGEVIAIDSYQGRVQVKWDNDPKSWVKADVVEPEHILYRIDTERRKIVVGKYRGCERTYKYYIPL